MLYGYKTLCNIGEGQWGELPHHGENSLHYPLNRERRPNGLCDFTEREASDADRASRKGQMASEEEESVKQINTAMNELNRITQENSELVNDSSSLGKEVVNGTANLYSELEYFKLDNSSK